MATIQYDDILLNIGSRANSEGIDKSISMLKELKSVFPISGLGDSAAQMKEFASALNSMDKNVVNALSRIHGNLNKVAQAARNTTKEIAKTQKAEAPKLNANKGEIKELLDTFGNVSNAYLKDMGYDPAAIRQVKEEMKMAKAESAKAAKEEAEATQEKVKAEAKFNEEFAKALAQEQEQARAIEQKALAEAKFNAEFEEELRKEKLIQDALAPYGGRTRKHSGRMYGYQIEAWKREAEQSGGTGENTFQKETWWNPGKVAKENAEAAKTFEAIVNGEMDATQNAEKFREQVSAIKDLLTETPTTRDSFLKYSGFDSNAITVARQEIAVAKEEQRQYNAVLKEHERQEREAAKAAEEHARELAKIAKEAEKAKSPLEKLADRFKKLMEYRLLRGVISGIASAIKGGITNMEQWSRKTGADDFYKSIDTAREAWEVLKNSLAVVVAPGLEWLISVFQKIAQAVMVAANAISRFFAILGGKSSYTTVKWADYSAKATDDYGHSLKKAKDDAKEFKKQLMGFDEINNITEKEKGGSGGSGGSGAAGGGFNFKDMFEEVELEDLSPFESYMKKVGEKWREGWQDLKDRATASWRHIKRGWKNFCAILGAIWTSVSTKAKEDWQHLVNFVKLIWNGTVTWFKNACENWKEGWQDVSERMKTAWERICKFVKDAWTTVKIVFLTVYMIIKDTFDKLAAIVKSIIERIVARFEYLATVTQNVMDLIAGKKSWSEFKDSMKTAADTMDKTIGKSVDELNAKLHKTFDTTWKLDANGKLILNEVDVSGLGSSYFKITKYASGGFPNTGSLFVAGEAGPEMVGTIGGSTAVANNEDIVSAVSQGVASAVASVLGGNGTNVTVVLEGDANKLFRVVQNQARNYARQTGSYAFG